MLAPSHGDRSKLHTSKQSMRASQWTALNWSCDWVQSDWMLGVNWVWQYEALWTQLCHLQTLWTILTHDYYSCMLITDVSSRILTLN
jgi:hypothetical protein